MQCACRNLIGILRIKIQLKHTNRIDSFENVFTLILLDFSNRVTATEEFAVFLGEASIDDSANECLIRAKYQNRQSVNITAPKILSRVTDISDRIGTSGTQRRSQRTRIVNFPRAITQRAFENVLFFKFS